ncbi:hypothetical protein EB118_15235 [bacterium]|nr:hypothetical protein [bacterium]NDC95000.1 hypothetical protein [bacterium]NDD82895.1 hypothetical protein [bacterium]NDG31407.1 hypothetical protein [bacterium]
MFFWYTLNMSDNPEKLQDANVIQPNNLSENTVDLSTQDQVVNLSPQTNVISLENKTRIF